MVIITRMTYALKIKSSTHGAGEQELSGLDPLSIAKLAPLEENTHSFILKYFKKEWKILEAGCGLGRWMIHLDDLGYSMSGIDISVQAIEKLKNIRPNLNLTLGDISSMPFEDGQFDAVLSVGVIEHDPEGPEKMLQEMNRVLRPDGVMIIIVPIENVLRLLVHRPLCAIRYSIMKICGKKLEFEEYRFSLKDILRRVQKSGLEILEYSWVDLTPPDKSYTLWVDWGGLFRNRISDELFTLNTSGRLIKRIMNSFSPWSIAEGVVIAVRKTSH